MIGRLNPAIQWVLVRQRSERSVTEVRLSFLRQKIIALKCPHAKMQWIWCWIAFPDKLPQISFHFFYLIRLIWLNLSGWRTFATHTPSSLSWNWSFWTRWTTRLDGHVRALSKSKVDHQTRVHVHVQPSGLRATFISWRLRQEQSYLMASVIIVSVTFSGLQCWKLGLLGLLL